MSECAHDQGATSCVAHGDLCVTCQAPTLHRGNDQRCGRCRWRDEGKRCDRCGSEWVHLRSHAGEILCARCVVTLAHEMGWDQPSSIEECQRMIRGAANDLERLAELRREKGDELAERVKRTTARRVQSKPAGPSLFEDDS